MREHTWTMVQNKVRTTSLSEGGRLRGSVLWGFLAIAAILFQTVSGMTIYVDDNGPAESGTGRISGK